MNRIFLVGTGESLNQTPLDLLKNEVTFSLNAIDRIYDRTDWRCTYYLCIDVNPRDPHWPDAVRANAGAKKLFLHESMRSMKFPGNVEYLTDCKNHKGYAADNHQKRAGSWHLPDVCNAFGSMYTMLQLAALMKPEVIYLVGCDLFGGQNHFDPEYGDFAPDGERNLDAIWLHSVSKMSSPVPIFNATVGGGLEVYPRVDIHQLLKGN